MAGAAATLTGLVFVALSINLRRVLSIPGLTGRAAESMMQLFGVMVISTNALIPRQTAVDFGAGILAIGFALWIVQTVLQIRYLRRKTGHPRRWGMVRIVQRQFANIPFCVSGILPLLGLAGRIVLAGARLHLFSGRRCPQRVGPADRNYQVSGAQRA